MMANKLKTLGTHFTIFRNTVRIGCRLLNFFFFLGKLLLFR